MAGLNVESKKQHAFRPVMYSSEYASVMCKMPLGIK